MRVLIVDDHRLFADAIAASLESHGLEVVGVALTGDQGCQLASSSRPDLVLVDIDLPDRSGLEVGVAIREAIPGTRIVALTKHDDRRLFNESARLEFDGFVSKDTPIGAFVEAVKATVAGHVVFARRTEPARSTEDQASLLSQHLTGRELEVLDLLVEGLSNADMARRLGISAHTVRTHVHSVLTKLQVHSRLEAATFAVRSGLIDERHRRRTIPFPPEPRTR